MGYGDSSDSFGTWLIIVLVICALVFGLFMGNVDEGVPLTYAQRAHPACTGLEVETHRWSSTSQTEVSMVCPDETRKSVTVKCVFGWGVFSETTCHINN